MDIDHEIKLYVHGIKHRYIKFKNEKKLVKLINILQQFHSKKVVIFLKTAAQCIVLVEILNSENLSAGCYTENTTENATQDVTKVIIKRNLEQFVEWFDITF